MEEIIELNPLGDTPREQWLTTARVFDTAIRSNITQSIDYMHANDQHDDGLEGELAEQLEAALRVLNNYTTEMNRLIEHVFTDERNKSEVRLEFEDTDAWTSCPECGGDVNATDKYCCSCGVRVISNYRPI